MLQIQDRFLKSFIYQILMQALKTEVCILELKRIKKALLKNPQGTKYCLKLDMKKYYPSIDNQILFEIVKTKIKDKKLLRLIELLFSAWEQKGNR